MSDTSGIINRVRFDSAVSTNSADVVVKGFSNNALQGILEAISKTNSVLNDLQSGLDEIQSDNDKRAQADEKKDKDAKKDRVASLASERRSRATNAAIYGEIQRGNIFNKMLREGLMEALSGLTDFLKDNLNQSLKSIQNLSTVMRKANLSQSDKDKVQRKAGDALGDVEKYFNGLQVSRDEVNSYFGDLLADGKDITALTAEQTASYVALRKSGLAADKAYVAAMTTSAKDLEKPINSLRMPGVAQAMNASMENVTSAQIAAMGGWDKAINSFSENSRQYVETLGMSGVATGDAADMVTGYTLAQHGLYDQLSDQQKNVAVFYKDSMANTASALKDASETLKLGARTGIFSDSYANIALMTDAGVSTGQRIYTDEEVGKANKVNTDKGIVQTGIDRLVAGVDKFTGGAISTMSNRLDEWFGEGVDIAKIVGTGFKVVIGLLGSIAMSKLIGGNPLSLLKSGISKLFPSLATGLSKGLSALLNPTTLAIGAAAASVGYAVYKITDTYNKLNKPDEIKENIRQNNAEIASVQNDLELAKKYGANADTIGKLEAKLADLRKTSQTLQNDLQQANEDAKSESEKAADEYNKKAREESKTLIHQANEKQRLAMLVKGKDEEEYNRLMKERDDLIAQSDKVLKDSQKIYATSHGLLASTFDLEPETMLAWANFTDGVGEFFTEDIPNFFMNTIPDALASACKWIWGKLSSFGKSVYGLLDDYVLTPISSAFSWLSEKVFTPVGDFFIEIGASINEKFVQPIKGFFSSINSFINEKFVQPIKGFFDFKWLPEPVYKFIFDEGYSATDMATDLSSTALDKGKELLDGAASTIAEGVDFVQGLWQGLWQFADGGVVNQATPAVVGEDGKEAILPLEKPDQLLSVLNKLTNGERADILKSILSSNNFSLDNLSNMLVNIASNGTHPSAVNSSLIGNIGKSTPAVVGEDRSGDSSSIENIIAVSEAYTPTIGDSYIDNLFKSSGLLTVASNAVNLSNFISKFIDVDQDTTAKQIESNSLAKEYIEAVKVIRSSSSDEAKQAAAHFSKTAVRLLGDKSSSPEILSALSVMIKYLRDIASSPANKKVISSASRPISMSY